MRFLALFDEKAVVGLDPNISVKVTVPESLPRLPTYPKDGSSNHRSMPSRVDVIRSTLIMNEKITSLRSDPVLFTVSKLEIVTYLISEVRVCMKARDSVRKGIS